MSKPVEFDLAARDEVGAATDWYASRVPALASEFVAEVEAGVAAISHPSRYAPVRGVTAELAVRRLLLRRFPYAIVFIELPDRVRVLAVMHQKQRPDYWKGRLRRR